MTSLSSYQEQRGFIALISVLIISAVLLVTVLSLAQFGVASRVFLLDLENKTASAHLASACVEIARVLAYNNQNQTMNSIPVQNVGTETCVIDSIAPISSTESRIEAYGERGDAHTTYCVLLEHADGTIKEWKEVDAPADCP